MDTRTQHTRNTITLDRYGHNLVIQQGANKAQ